MADDQFKVPESVTDVYWKVWDETEGSHTISLQAALAQHHKELLGDEAVEAGAKQFHRVLLDNDNVADFTASAWIIQAAIDSVMKGGE